MIMQKQTSERRLLLACEKKIRNHHDYNIIYNNNMNCTQTRAIAVVYPAFSTTTASVRRRGRGLDYVVVNLSKLLRLEYIS